MRILRSLGQNLQGGVVTVGNFDGLHLGHQSLLRQMQAWPGPRTVVTFDPHPLQVLHPEKALKLVFPREDLVEQLPAYGIDQLAILRFNSEFAKLSAREFLDRYLAQGIQPKQIVEGHDFAFGRGREGTLDVMKEWAAAHAIGVEVVPPFKLNGEVVSSRGIRDKVTSGDVRGAAAWLGRPYYVRGEVVSGAGRGARIGVPTLNQRVANETLPALGVYASRVRFKGKSYGSVTNVGTNPTFESGPAIKVETHVLDTVADWRGQIVDVDLIERLRDEKKFSSIEDLKNQIQSDILKARDVLSK